MIGKWIVSFERFIIYLFCIALDIIYAKDTINTYPGFYTVIIWVRILYSKNTIVYSYFLMYTIKYVKIHNEGKISTILQLVRLIQF